MTAPHSASLLLGPMLQDAAAGPSPGIAEVSFAVTLFFATLLVGMIPRHVFPGFWCLIFVCFIKKFARAQTAVTRREYNLFRHKIVQTVRNFEAVLVTLLPRLFLRRK